MDSLLCLSVRVNEPDLYPAPVAAVLSEVRFLLNPELRHGWPNEISSTANRFPGSVQSFAIAAGCAHSGVQLRRHLMCEVAGASIGLR